MPGQDGYEVCQRLKTNPTTTHIPVIFVTAGQRETVTRLAAEVGAAAVLTEPFPPRGPHQGGPRGGAALMPRLLPHHRCSPFPSCASGGACARIAESR